jgi:phosphatidylglycerophosphate synthase
LTVLGLTMAAVAIVILCAWPEWTAWVAIPVWLAWFFDRADGMLARCQGTVSTWGAWLDANVDELVDVALQVAVTAALARQVDASWPWFLLVAFLAGKYLLMYGLMVEEVSPAARSRFSTETNFTVGDEANGFRSGLRSLYHLPGNCDVRVHWLILMLLLNQLAIELAVVAGYYNLRWIVRYAIVWRRSGRRD